MNKRGTGINEKQRKFAHYYYKDLNATQAAIKAGYSRKAASEHASRLLSNANVKTEIDRLRKQMEAKSILSIEKQQKRLEMIASVTIDMYISYFDGLNIGFKDITEWSPEMKMACEGVKTDKFGRVTLVLQGKSWAFDQIQKHLGFYAKDNDQKKLSEGVIIMLPDNKRGKVVSLTQEEEDGITT